MQVRDFDYELPPDRIAQEPAAVRDQARLYLLPRAEAAVDEAVHARVADLPGLLADRLPGGALLVVNDSRVIPARLHGRKDSGGRVELLLVAPRATRREGVPWEEEWLCLGGASKPIRAGMSVTLDGERAPAARVLAVDGQRVTVAFSGAEPGGLLAAAERIGEVPLPPYIRRPGGPRPDDAARYQTVYARAPGSVAAPTAGLHLTPTLLEALAARGVERASVTLHVGLGTFAPIAQPDDAPLSAIGELHPERFTIPAATGAAVRAARAAGRPVIAVGTTTARALESAADAAGHLREGEGETRLFIAPGHRFRVVDGLLTNFHLPRSTLLMLVAALAGRERLLAAYRDAIARGYRFYSFGDAMLLCP